MEIKELEQLLNIIKHSDISEFELDREGVHLRVSRGVRHAVSGHASVVQNGQAIEPAIALHSPVASASIGGAPSANSHLTRVESPIVGTFYRKPSPDAESFVKEGDRVKKGDTLCIIEAMKLMNEIESPCDGIVEKIVLVDGKVVEFGELLFLIDPSV